MKVKRKSSKPKKPVRPRTPYMLFVKWVRTEFKGFYRNFKELSQSASRSWKKLTPGQKARFERLAFQDKSRYARELEEYERDLYFAEQAKLEKMKKKKKVKDPNAPKRAVSSFVWFSRDYRKLIKQRYPSWDFGDIQTALGRIWAALDHELKYKYVLLAMKDRVRYRKQMQIYTAPRDCLGRPIIVVW